MLGRSTEHFRNTERKSCLFSEAVITMNSYLRLAESVLKKSEQALSASEILEAAYRLQLVPEHLYGKTQHMSVVRDFGTDGVLR